MDKKEQVDHPKHYGGDTTYECIKVLKAWNTPEEFIGFCKDNAIKYLCEVVKKTKLYRNIKKLVGTLTNLLNIWRNRNEYIFDDKRC